MTGRSNLYRVAAKLNVDILPEDAQRIVRSALGYGGGLRHWVDVPGLLCAFSAGFEEDKPAWKTAWSRLHGMFDADFDTFERDFLPFVLDRAETCAVRVYINTAIGSNKMGLLERWYWWPGSTVEEMCLNIVAAEVMES